MTITITLEDDWNNTYQRALLESPEQTPLEIADAVRRYFQMKHQDQLQADAQWALAAYAKLPPTQQDQVTAILETVLPRS